MRIDTSLPPDQIQILVVVNSRELCNQVHKVYERLIQDTDITLSNFCSKNKRPSMVVVTVHGSLGPLLSGRKPLNLKSLKCVVVDEADVFFQQENFEHIWKLKDNKQVREAENHIQWILFSATFPVAGADPRVDEIIDKLVGKCIQIKVSAEDSMLRINSIQQYVFRVDEKKKLDFIKEVFVTCEST